MSDGGRNQRTYRYLHIGPRRMCLVRGLGMGSVSRRRVAPHMCRLVPGSVHRRLGCARARPVSHLFMEALSSEGRTQVK